MKKFYLRFFFLFCFFLAVLLNGGDFKTVKIVKTFTLSSTNDVSICAKTDRYFNATNGDLAKEYIKLIPNQYFKVTLSYDTICINSLKPQMEYSVTIDKNIPLGDVSLDKSYNFYLKTGDYEPSFKFKESGYILPSHGNISIPIETINIDKLSIGLYRINKNNLIGAINRYALFRDISSYTLDDIEQRDGYLLWKKRLRINNYQRNRAKITAIPVGEYLKKVEPGVYILWAAAINKDGQEDRWNSATQWFMVSDIGLFTLQGEEGLHVYCKHLSDARRYKNVHLELISQNNELLAKKEAVNGYAFFKNSLLKGKKGLKPKAIYAYGENGDFTVLDLSKPPLDLTDRGVGGRDVPKGYDGFIYSNRAIFKPGESVVYNLLVRDTLGNVAKNIKLKVALINARGEEVESKTLSTDNLGYCRGEFNISKNAPTGRYNIAAFAGSDEAIAKFSFLLEDFIPPKIELKLIEKPKELKPKELYIIKAYAKYLTGDNMPNPSGDFQVILHKAKEPFKEYQGYYFGKVDESFSNYYALEDNFIGDSNGTIEIPVKLTSTIQSSLPLSAYIKINVNEPGGRGVSKGFDIFFNDKPGYIGIKPNFKYDSVDLNVKPSFNLIYIKDSKAISKKLHYRLIEEEVEWNWQSNDDGSWEYYKTYSDYAEVKNGDIEIKAYPTPFILDKLEWGTYRLEISDDLGVISSYRFSVGYESSASKTSPDRLPIAIDKKEYSLNDTLKINITPKFSGPVIINIANSRIIETKELKAKEGVPLKAEFKVKKSWGSSAYVLATAFRAQNKKLGANRAVGVAFVSIKDPSKIIKLNLKAPKKILANSKLLIEVSAKNRQEPTFVTVAAVDKGILNLTNYKTPNPAQYFWGQKKLSVLIKDVYSDLIKARGEHGEFDVGAGDELEEGLNEELTVNKREVVALISKAVKLKNGKAKVEFNIPSFQGSLKIMAVAWSKKGVGSSDTLTIVKDPISIEAYMPRFLAFNDSAKILLNAKFDNSVIKKGKYTFKIETKGGIKAFKSSFDFDYNGKNEFMKYLPIKADKIEDGTIIVSVYKNGNQAAQREFKLAVRSPYVQNYIRRVGVLDIGGALDSKKLLDTSKWLKVNKIRLEILGAPLIDADSIKKELIDYCCRCAEQTTSRAFPFIKSKKESEIQIVQNAIERLKSMQKIDGSFGLWFNSDSSTWISAYVLDFLTRAKENGFEVPDKNIKEGLKWLQNSLYKWSLDGAKQEADAYALYVLARNGKILMSDILYHANNTQSKIKSGLAWGYLAAALNISGERKKAKEIFELAKSNLNSNRDYFANYGGSLRDKAGLIVLLKEANFDSLAWPLFVDLALDVKDKRYLSTQEMSQIIRAENLIDIKPSRLNLLIDNRAYKGVKKVLLDINSTKYLPKVINKGNKSVWYSLSFIAVPNAFAYNEADNRGFKIFKEYYTIDGKKINSNQLAKGQRVVIVLSGKIEDSQITHPIIIDLLASGFEIENPNISGIDEVEALGWLKGLSATLHKGYRDDRFTAAIKKDGSEFKTAYIVRAATLGKFANPPALIEDMYKARYRALSKFNSDKIEIKRKEDIIPLNNQTEQNLTKPNITKLTSQDYLLFSRTYVRDLSRYSVVQLNHLRNGIFAQVGLDFSKTNPALYKLFSQFDWYKPTISSGSVAFAKLTPIQKKNVLALLKEEKKRCGGSLSLADFYRVNTKLLSKKDLAKYSKRDLRILRNSLIARYGYVFKDKELNKIFKEMPWYKANPSITASEIIDKKMNDIQRANLQTLLEVQKSR